MNSFILLLLLVSSFMMVRAFSFGMTHVTMHGYRKSECIERIVNEQKACDFINATYQFIITLINLYIIGGCLLVLFESSFMNTFKIIALLTIFSVYVAFFIIKSKTLIQFNLPNFYNNMVDYRSKQKVVTKDNDNEVDFIRSYQKTINQKIKMNIWFISSLILFLYIF